MLGLISQIIDKANARLAERKDEGQGMAEYGLILAGVALLAIVAVFLLGPQIGALLNKVNASLS
jgi:pilus assembly protein Flp/PilA